MSMQNSKAAVVAVRAWTTQIGYVTFQPLRVYEIFRVNAYEMHPLPLVQDHTMLKYAA